MATIDVSRHGVTHPSRMTGAVPYRTERVIDLAEVIASKGSALASADVIEAIAVPAGSQVLFAGLQVVEVMTGTSTDATVDLGDGGDPDRYVAAFDLDAATKGAYAPAASTAVSPTVLAATADTIDIVFGTFTGTVTGGKIRVFATLLDLTPVVRNPGIAVPGS